MEKLRIEITGRDKFHILGKLEMLKNEFMHNRFYSKNDMHFSWLSHHGIQDEEAMDLDKLCVRSFDMIKDDEPTDRGEEILLALKKSVSSIGDFQFKVPADFGRALIYLLYLWHTGDACMQRPPNMKNAPKDAIPILSRGLVMWANHLIDLEEKESKN